MLSQYRSGQYGPRRKSRMHTTNDTFERNRHYVPELSLSYQRPRVYRYYPIPGSAVNFSVYEADFEDFLYLGWVYKLSKTVGYRDSWFRILRNKAYVIYDHLAAKYVFNPFQRGGSLTQEQLIRVQSYLNAFINEVSRLVFMPLSKP